MSRARAHLVIALSVASLALAGLLVLPGCGGRSEPRASRDTSYGGEATTATYGAETTTTTSGGSAREERYSVDAEVASEPTRAPAVVPSAPAAAHAGTRMRDPIVAVPRPEPSPWNAHEWVVAPARPQRVMLATVEVPPGETLRPPATSCQDVILFVREGQLEATGTGIATADAPITLYRGDAVRFGPEGDGLAVNTSTRRARTVMAIARREGEGPPRPIASRSDACAVAASSTDPLRRPLRAASIATTPPLAAAGGRLEVRILLDTDATGSEHGSLAWLEGASDLVIPEHRHDDAAEVLLIEEGSGTLRLGDREVAVRAGSAIYVPEGTLHSFRGAGARPLRAIQIYAPAGAEQRCRGM